MRRFFAALRRILALDKAARGIGAIAAEVVRDDFIPRLNRQMDKARNERERNRIADLIAEYEQYLNESTPAFRRLGDIAEAAIVLTVKMFGLSEEYEDEVASRMAYDFYNPLYAGKDLRAYLKGFPVEKPHRLIEFEKLFSRIVKMRVHGMLRDEMRRHPDVYKKRDEPAEEGMDSPVDRIRDPGKTPLEELEQQEEVPEDIRLFQIKKRMSDYVRGHSHDDAMRALYDAWIRVIERRGPAINMKRDVYPAIAQTYNVSMSGLNARFMDIKKLIERFFREELGVRMTDALKKRLHIGAVDVLTFEWFRRRFAAWMLGCQTP